MPSDECDSSSSDHRSWLAIEVVGEAGDWSAFGDTAALAARAAAAVADAPSLKSSAWSKAPAEACLALSDDERVRELNRHYRRKDMPTNVLSFPAPDIPEGVALDGPRPLGDIILAQETVLREAAGEGTPPEHHFQHLVVHGLLHLMGYDHETDDEAEEMEAVEVGILATLGIASPYEGEVVRRAVIKT